MTAGKGTPRRGRASKEKKLSLERIIATPGFLPRSFFSSGMARADAVGRIVIADEAGRIEVMGTGFLIANACVMTCHHIIPDRETTQRARIEFDFFQNPDGSVNRPSSFTFSPQAVFATNPELDVTIVKLDNSANLGARRPIDLAADGTTVVGDSVNVIHHSGGEPQRLTIRESEVLTINGPFIEYTGDTGAGSAGAPIFNDQWQFLGMHHAARPATDAAGNLLAVDGSIWGGDTEEEIQLFAKEGIRSSAIRSWMASVKSPEVASHAAPGDEKQPVITQNPQQGGGSLPTAARDSVFISYAHKDQVLNNWKDRLVLQLTPIASIGETRVWDDTRIEAGTDWLHEIEYALERTKVAVLLIGPHFLNSKFVANKELPPLLDAARTAGLRIFPLITDYAPYYLSVLSAYQSFNNPEKPLESLQSAEQNRLLLSLATKIAEVFATA